ncbi:MAG TPA: nicotinate-nucleotide--dimethylbenzimidazole phosphoribosyltransferase, partial [Nitrospiria bacterium]|nr:nicotinate-nucleotide--dimethylbenzimidazole phosphoribosyltransferase [Nitrospiria bacterium]
MEMLKKAIEGIRPIDPEIGPKLQRRLDFLTKPPGSLGRIEELALWYGSARGEIKPVLGKKAVAVFAADHGIAAEGVSAYPKEVTAQMVYNFLRGGAAINAIARQIGADVVVVDIGVDHDFQPVSGLRIRKVAKGTANMISGPAMSREEALKAVSEGIVLAQELGQ